MPRGPRIDAPGLLQHVIARGIDKSTIFKDHSDRLDFLKRLEELLLSHDAKCFAWALIPNHFHLLIRTGKKPLSSLMRRLLTGYAVTHNLRHQRSGHLFQNRYKSVVCEEDTYLLELVTYIHLNPIRAGLVREISELDTFPWSGHAALIGKHLYSWQQTDEVLALFEKNKNIAKKKYRQFVVDRISKGKRYDLTSGGFIIGSTGLADVSNRPSQGFEHPFDERILGGAGFVEQVLEETQRNEKESVFYKNKIIMSLDQLLAKVAQYYNIPAHRITSGRKQQEIIQARSVFSYLSREYLQVPGKELAKILKLSPSAIVNSITRGEEITRENNRIKEAIFREGE